MGERLYLKAKKITNLFCLAIVALTVGLFLLRLTALSGMVRDVPDTPEPVPDEVVVEGSSVGYRILDKIDFSSPDAIGNITIENNADNDFYIRLEIIYDISGKSIYLSPFLKPGDKITSARLQGESLRAGEYKCTAVITAYDPSTRKELDSQRQPVTIRIGSADSSGA